MGEVRPYTTTTLNTKMRGGGYIARRRKRRSIPRVERRVRLPRLIVGRRRGAHLAGHTSGWYECGLRADPCRVDHGRHVMVPAAAVVVGERGPTGRRLHGHQFGRRHGDQIAVTTAAAASATSAAATVTTV